MYNDGPSWVVTEDRLQLKLIVPTAPGMDIGFGAAGTDAMLATVAGLRAGMAPSVDLADPDPKRLTATFGAWRVVSDQKGGVVLATAHPGYGWVAIALEPQTIADLVRELIAISDPEAPPSTARRRTSTLHGNGAADLIRDRSASSGGSAANQT